MSVATPPTDMAAALDAEPLLMTAPMIAPYVDKHPDTVRRWLNSGAIPTVVVRSRVFVRRSDLKAFLGV